MCFLNLGVAISGFIIPTEKGETFLISPNNLNDYLQPIFGSIVKGQILGQWHPSFTPGLHLLFPGHQPYIQDKIIIIIIIR